MSFFDELPDQEKDQILSYFKEHERRTPDTTAIFVCLHCRIVYDDFSGEKRSMEGDTRSICKVCQSPSVDHLGVQVVTG